MKKIIVFIFLFMLCISVKAKENDTFYMSRIYSNVFAVQEYSTGGRRMYYARQYLMTKNNITEVGYCIELGADLGAEYYSSTSDYNLVGLDEESSNYIKLLAYYGYQYEDHYDYRYYLATQELIWEYLSGDEIYWVNGESYDASRIDVESMKDEILYLVNRHNIKPQFDYVDINYGNSVTLSDNNNILDQYEVIDIKNGSYRINGNNIIITSTNFNDVEITLARKIIKNEKDVFLYSDISQNIIIPGVVGNNLVTYKFNNNGIKLKINKKDYDSGDNIYNSNVGFRIFNVDNDEYLIYDDIDTFDVNDEGFVIIPNIGEGNYRLEEVDNGIEEYLYNEEALEFNINIDDLFYNNYYGYYYEVDFYNYKPKGSIEINKKGEEFIVEDNDYYYKDVYLEDIEFDVITKQDIFYNDINYKSNDVILTVKTDSNGQVVIDNLPLGLYIIKEVKTNDNYYLDDNLYEVNLEYKDAYTSIISNKLDINNYLKKGRLEICKIDSESRNTLEGVLFVVYDINNRILFEGKTNKEGKIILDNLIYGTYYIKEISSIEDYIIDNKIYEVIIDDNNKYQYLEIVNDRIKPPKTGNKYLDNILAIFIIISFLSIKKIKIML